MVLATLNVQKTGMITLPKKWRDRHPALRMIAEETPEGLLIRPVSEIEYYEEENGSFGLRFPLGMDMRRFQKMFLAAEKRLSRRKIVGKKQRPPQR